MRVCTLKTDYIYIILVLKAYKFTKVPGIEEFEVEFVLLLPTTLTFSQDKASISGKVIDETTTILHCKTT